MHHDLELAEDKCECVAEPLACGRVRAPRIGRMCRPRGLAAWGGREDEWQEGEPNSARGGCCALSIGANGANKN